MMKNKSNLLACAVALLVTGGAVIPSEAAFDENLNTYTLDAVVVNAERTKNQFGDTITEQSYYRTGGDVKVISREEIEKRHYNDVTEAIKRIPGVTFTNAGYRGGQYGYNPYSNKMAINGDSRVIVLIDGRRVDNSTSTNMGSSNSSGSAAMVDLNQIINMEAVDKIEVIKGPGASAYGSDATGGVINIITRKGGIKNQGSIDISTGSWKKHVYNVSYSGALGNDKSWKYFFSATRNMAGNSKYHDGLTDTDRTYYGTKYKDEGVNFRLDKDFGNNRDLKIWYNHQNGKDGYPITARDYRYWTQADWNRNIYGAAVLDHWGNTQNPGYRNLFSLDALSGSYNAYKDNDIDVSYTFAKDNGMESFIRFYSQKRHYWGIDRYPYSDNNWIGPDGSYVPFPDSPEWSSFIKNYHPDGWDDLTGKFYEENHGVQLQLAKSLGINDVLASVTIDKAKTSTFNNYGDVKNTYSRRKSILGYLQDKIHITDKWDLTPALRYAHYSEFTGKKSDKSFEQIGGSSVTWTPSLSTEYAFSDSMSAYAGWTKVYRPIKQSDYSKVTPNGEPLKDEEGNVWTVGIHKMFDDKTDVAVHYDWTDMSNAITYYTGRTADNKHFQSKAVNAKETKKSFNITVDHKISDRWNFSLGYTHLNDKWRAKDGMQFDSDLGLSDLSNVNTQINKLRPANHYTANFTYEQGKWYSGLLVNWYTGCDTEAFTHKRALVLDWNLNYEINKDISTYVTVTNLTNQAYENAYSAYNGKGAAPQPGRAWMFGVKYKF